MLSVPTTVHGRVLIESDEDAAVASGVIVGFHGYGENAEDMMAALRLIPGASAWMRVSIQALNRFYTRGDTKVVANWMTREDREQAIADNVAYVNAALDQVLARAEARALQQMEVPGRGGVEVPGFSPGRTPLVFAGFSQGVAMAYRAALLGSRSVSGVIALAGDIPPELKTDAPTTQPWPRVLIGVGDGEEWYSPDKVEDDRAFLEARGVPHTIERFDGGHEWTEAFRTAAGRFLDSMI